ncbi:hypothetical protein BB8028_0009g00010 [Beauveria bassiana]|uniref:Uncharacterized protein n=1 Tax=Beauveria bassiana TaxID=176275 RepID=A0A2S7YNM5_BEABA|nr:hypothetical protein BB8028_0009g00010 [Beauveria bassiana]
MQHPAAEQTIAWPPYEPGVERVVATFDIRHRDWLFSTSCKEVKDINYELKVANVEGAGTYDKVWFTLGDKDDKEPKQTVVGYGLTAGDIKKGSVGSNEEIVPLSHLKQVAISEEHRWFRPFANTWTFESIIFTATCASSGQKLLMDKYDWIHANLYRVDDTPVWTGDFSAWDWLEVHGK